MEGLAAEIQQHAWDLALEVVEEGLRDDTMPSLARVGRLGQLGDLPTFVSELGRGLSEPDRGLLRPGSKLAALARDHAREREALGFDAREIVTEFLLLRRVLWRFASERGLPAELDYAIDRLLTECVVAYFDRATTELAHRARRDALTGLFNHQAFTQELELELERAKRYEHPLALVFFDVDRFKSVNDTFGHPEGDRVLRLVAATLDETLRRTDVAGRMGGDEFAATLVESDPEAAGQVLARLVDRLDELTAAGVLPPGFSISPGIAHYPEDGLDADALFRAADARSYEVKRARSSAA